MPAYRNRVFALLLLPFFAAPSLLQAELVGESVTYDVDGDTYEGYFARNSALGDAQPVVVIVHDWDGVTAYERGRADMLAKLGYAAFAIDLYGEGVRPESLEDKKARSGELYQDREMMRARMQGALDHLQGLDGVDAGQIVVAGYCFGGSAALELARSGAQAQGFAVFHGGLQTPEGQDFSDAQAPILVMHGSNDDSAPMSQVAELAEAMDRDGVHHTMEIYGGAPHAFTVWGEDRYRAEADLASWATFTEFLEERLD